ncbi:MAG: T9SS type A sorting domain-containing protein [Chitinophagales bacterium]
MKKIPSLFVLLAVFQLKAQYAPSFSVGYDTNYVSVNKSNFSPTSGTITYNDTQKYVSTILNISTKIHVNLMSLNGLLSDPNLSNYTTLTQLDQTPAYSYNKIVRTNGIIARKVMYAKNHISGQTDKYVRMLIVRPDDNLTRPCVMITNGANAMYSLNSGSVYYSVMADLALRGYIAVFFESVSNDLSTIATYVSPNNYPCNYNPSNSINVEKNAYANFQYGVAAFNYILLDASLPLSNRLINANINDIHGFGISMGGATMFMLGYSRQNNYNGYMHDFYTGVNCSTLVSDNKFTKLCINGNPTSNLNLKSITSGAGVLPQAGGDYFSTVNSIPVKTIPTMLLYGSYDKLVKYDLQNASKDTVNFGNIYTISMDSIRRTLKLLNKPNKLVVNCVGGHGFGRDIDQPSVSENISLNNTQQISSVQYPGYLEYINTNDKESNYTAFSLDGLCFRKFSTELAYSIFHISNLNTILTNFIRDVRINNINSYYNNNPQYVTTPNAYSCSPCFIFLNRCASANLDAHIENSSACPIPMNGSIRPNTQFLRTVKPDIKENSLEIKDEFLMYPNPANDYIYIKYAANSSKTLNIKLYNYIGKIIMQSSYAVNIGDNNIMFNASDYPNGVYLLSIENDSEIYTDKVIISHK